MMVLLILMIAVSLSMDAFSLSLAYGTLNLSKKERISLAMIVGVYHFIMPLIGHFIGDALFYYIPVDPDIIICIILGVIGFGMISDTFHEEEEAKKMKVGELLFFGLAVSIDSFSVGIGLHAITDNIIFSASLFSITSACFTYFGLCLGNKISHMIGKSATAIGGIVLFVIGITVVVT